MGESVTCLSANEGARQVWRENGEAEQKKNEGEFESWRRAPAAREVWCRKVVCFTSKRVLCKARVLKTVRVVTAGESQREDGAGVHEHRFSPIRTG